MSDSDINTLRLLHSPFCQNAVITVHQETTCQPSKYDDCVMHGFIRISSIAEIWSALAGLATPHMELAGPSKGAGPISHRGTPARSFSDSVQGYDAPRVHRLLLF